MLLLHHSILLFLGHISQSDDVVRNHYSWISNDPSPPWGAGAFASRVQRYLVGHCIALGLAVRPALLLSALEEGWEESRQDGRQPVLFLNIQRGLESWFIKICKPEGVQLVWQRPLGFDYKPGFLPVMATLSVCVGCNNLSFFPKLKDECLTVPYIYILSKTSREF